MLAAGFVVRGQGVRCTRFGGYGTIQRSVAEVDGEQFVIVKFRDGEQLLSVLELLPATQLSDSTEETEVETEEVVFSEVEDHDTREIEIKAEDRAGELESEDSEDQNAETEEFEEEAEAVEEFEE